MTGLAFTASPPASLAIHRNAQSTRNAAGLSQSTARSKMTTIPPSGPGTQAGCDPACFGRLSPGSDSGTSEALTETRPSRPATLQNSFQSDETSSGQVEFPESDLPTVIDISGESPLADGTAESEGAPSPRTEPTRATTIAPSRYTAGKPRIQWTPSDSYSADAGLGWTSQAPRIAATGLVGYEDRLS